MESTPLSQPLPRRAILKGLLGLLAILGAIMGLAWVARDPIEALSGRVVDAYGLIGIFVIVALMDPIPGPGHDVGLVLGWAGGLGFWGIYLAASLGTIVGSALSWGLGRWIGHWPSIQAALDRYELREKFLKYGAKAVALAAIAPVPYAVATIGAGACGVPFGVFILGSMARPLKVLVALALIATGWGAVG